ncbi:MAG: Hpt domain-containing protein [Gammaproteobacteria bacterium]|nr:Hpt domain-containing protein [Gammaproteobacteria bacterium]
MNQTNSIDIASIETLKGLMKDRFNFLIETFFINMTKNIEELQAAIDNKDTANIVTIFHSIKGSSGSVGAISIHQLSARYEERARHGDMIDIIEWIDKLSAEFERYKDDIQSYL